MTTAVAKRQSLDMDSPATVGNIKSLIFSPKREDQMRALLPANIKPDSFRHQVVLMMNEAPYLQNCSLGSVYGSVLAMMKLGLLPGNHLGQAYIVPYKGKAQLQIGYRGYITLARRSSHIADIYAELVYTGEEFNVSLGTDRAISHVPNYDLRDDENALTHAYAVAIYKDKEVKPAFVVLTRKQLEARKQMAIGKLKGYQLDNSPWTLHFAAMCLKTPIRDLCSKYLDLSPEDMRFASRIDAGQVAVASNPDSMDVEEIEWREVDNEEREDELPELPKEKKA